MTNCSYNSLFAGKEKKKRESKIEREGKGGGMNQLKTLIERNLNADSTGY